jgi:hypothetical protein
MFKRGLVAHDRDDVVIHFNAVDDQAQVALRNETSPMVMVLAHGPTKTLDHIRGDFGRRRIGRLDPVQSRLCTLACEFQTADALPEDARLK